VRGRNIVERLRLGDPAGEEAVQELIGRRSQEPASLGEEGEVVLGLP
jgi:hypothetical protein